jgi:hypothetical protein
MVKRLEACVDCQEKFVELIDFNTIILQAAELRIVDQLDNLYLLKDPEVSEGVLEPVEDFNVRIFNEFSATPDIVPTPHGIHIPQVAEVCPEESFNLQMRLEELAQQISDAYTFEMYLKAEVKACLEATEDEYLMLLNENLPRDDEATDIVIMALEEIWSVKADDGEDLAHFTARMKVKFDSEDTTTVDTGIEIADLPPNAPPSTTNAKRLLENFNDQLAYQLSWAQWLMDELYKCCDDVTQSYIDIEEDMQPALQEKVVQTALILDSLYTLRGITGDQNDFAIEKRMEFDSIKSTLESVDSGIEVNDPPHNCQEETFDARDGLIEFSDAYSDLSTYLKWLEGEMSDASDDLRDDILDVIIANEEILDQKDIIVDNILDNLFTMLAEEGEDFSEFSLRMRNDF